MNEYTKTALRQLVLEHRVKLRIARAKAEEAAQVYSAALTEYEAWCDRIIDLQQACDDPVDIDPQYPELTPLRLKLKEKSV